MDVHNEGNKQIFVLLYRTSWNMADMLLSSSCHVMKTDDSAKLIINQHSVCACVQNVIALASRTFHQ